MAGRAAGSQARRGGTGRGTSGTGFSGAVKTARSSAQLLGRTTTLTSTTRLPFGFQLTRRTKVKPSAFGPSKTIKTVRIGRRRGR